jgi:ribosomal subunit interface protein
MRSPEMRVPLELSFRNVPKTERIEQMVREQAARLERFHDQIISCRVAIDKPQEHQSSGSPFRVRISLRIPPGHELAVDREPGRDHLHDDLPTVINRAFESLERQVKRLKDKQEGEVKRHPDQEAGGIVNKIFAEEGYGFVRSVDGRDIYFHRNAVLEGDFDRLEIGTGVHFVEEAGEEGPQASTVRIVDKPG